MTQINDDALRSELTKWITTLSRQQLLAAWRLRHRMLGQSSTAAPDPDWIHINDLAATLALDPGHLRRLCILYLAPFAQAKKMSPASGRKPTWFVHKDFDRTLLSAHRAHVTAPVSA